MEAYNGWTNRNTWLINLWFGDIIRQEIEEDVATTEEMIETIVMDCIYQEVALFSLMLRDFCDFDGINWAEIREHLAMDIFYGAEAI